MDRSELERLDRESLVLRAEAAGVKRARVLTRPELIDEILRAAPIDPAQLRKTRGFFGIARDLLSRVVERGLHLPNAADRFRAAFGGLPEIPRPEPQAVPTVTLAEIYAAQGHRGRAVDTLRRVLDAEPEHRAARALLETLEGEGYVPPSTPLAPEAPDPSELSELSEREPSPAAAEDDGSESVGLARAAAPASPAHDGSVVPEGLADDEDARLHAGDDADDAAVTVRDPAPAGGPTARAMAKNRCLAVPAGRGRLDVTWTLSADELGQDAFFFVRVCVVRPAWDGPQPDTRDMACDPARGRLRLTDLPTDATVRVAVGRLEGGVFVSLAHSPDVERDPSTQALVEWTVEGWRLLDPEVGHLASAAGVAGA